MAGSTGNIGGPCEHIAGLVEHARGCSPRAFWGFNLERQRWYLDVDGERVEAGSDGELEVGVAAWARMSNRGSAMKRPFGNVRCVSG